MGRTTTISVGSDGVAIISIIKPVNSLSFDVLNSLKESFDQALERDDVKAIVVTGAKGQFCGGFDINALGELQEGKAMASKSGYASIHILSDTMETARKPSVAAIDGLALGGGLEVAMACNARIATSTAQLSLPELQLGIIPGVGGTQRLPRLVGLAKALEMMLTSKLVHGEEAHKLGLVDAVVSGDKLLENARQMALDISACRKPWVSSLYKTDKIEPLGKVGSSSCPFSMMISTKSGRSSNIDGISTSKEKNYQWRMWPCGYVYESCVGEFVCLFV